MRISREAPPHANVARMTPPSDPIAAVRYANPYPYYDALRLERPFEYHASIGMWVAASAAAVEAVLGSSACKVRPAAEPVPNAIRDTAAGALFVQLIRMRDDPGRLATRQCLSRALERVNERELDALVVTQLKEVLASAARATTPTDRLGLAMLTVPVRTLAALLGVPSANLAAACQMTREFVRCLAVGASVDVIARGSRAASDLTALVDASLRDRAATTASALRSTSASRLELDEPASAALTANAIGLLMQAYEADAGLIGNTIVAWARDETEQRSAAIDQAHPDLDELARTTRLDAFIERVLRDDPPVQNTRRFVARDCRVADNQLRAGDQILVVLAAAQRDPMAGGLLAFGHGAHACPGRLHACVIARAVTREMLLQGLDPCAVLNGLEYLPYPNLRIPQFGAGHAANA
jgi:cytochrome P450